MYVVFIYLFIIYFYLFNYLFIYSIFIFNIYLFVLYLSIYLKHFCILHSHASFSKCSVTCTYFIVPGLLHVTKVEGM